MPKGQERCCKEPDSRAEILEPQKFVALSSGPKSVEYGFLVGLAGTQDDAAN